MTQIITNVEQIFEHANLHMKDKLKHFSKQGQDIVKYIVSKLRKYKGDFFESYSTIATELGYSSKTVQRVVKRCEELEIFVVSSRKESTLNGKMRTTTNKIQLLPYKTVEVVKEVVETVRQVVKKVVEKVERVAETHSKTSTTKKPIQPYNSKRPIRTEVVPTWLNVEYVKPQETDEVKRMREILMKGGIL